MEWYTIENTEAVDTPALIIYPDRVEKNIEIVKTFVNDVAKLRPHIKTSKCPAVIQLMLDGGITKFKCATIAEAEMLARLGAKDVLLAYQPLGPKVKRFLELQSNYTGTRFSCLADNPGALADLSSLAIESGQNAHVFIDLNVGMNRTGIAPGPDALDLFRQANAAEAITFAGLHAYDGHIRDADLKARTEKCDLAFRGVEALAGQIADELGKPPLIVVGGTPTFPIHAKRAGVECSPGTFIFWDKGYQQILAEQPFEFAAVVATRVISKPDASCFCVDLGHKSIAAENPLAQRVYFLNAPECEPVGHSEEHMVWRTAGEQAPRVGDVLYGIPHHVCPTVALYDEASVCTDHQVRETWPIVARKRKINI